MELLLLVALVAGICYLFNRASDRREQEMADRLERARKKLHGTEAEGWISGSMDAAIAQSKVDAQATRDFLKRP